MQESRWERWGLWQRAGYLRSQNPRVWSWSGLLRWRGKEGRWHQGDEAQWMRMLDQPPKRVQHKPRDQRKSGDSYEPGADTTQTTLLHISSHFWIHVASKDSLRRRTVPAYAIVSGKQPCTYIYKMWPWALGKSSKTQSVIRQLLLIGSSFLPI